MADSQDRISPEVELRAVKEELELAKKTRDRYALLVTKLYDELDTLRNGICSACKTKFIAGAASSSSAGRSSFSLAPTPRSIPLWKRLFGGRPSQHQTNPGHPQTVALSDVCNTESPTEQASIEPTLIPSATQPQTSAAIDDIAEFPEATSDQADWSVVHNHEVRPLDIHLAQTLIMKSRVYCVKFSRDGKYLAVGLQTGETYIHDLKTLSYKILMIVEYPPKEQPAIYAMQFSPDDKYIATGQSDGRIRVWNLTERRVVATFIKGHTFRIFSIDFSPNGQYLLSGSWDGSVRIWCMRDGSSKKLLDLGMADITSAAMSLDGRYVATGDYYDGILKIRDIRSGQLLLRWKADQVLWSMVFTPDGKRLLSGGNDKTLKSWDISSLMDSQSGSRRGNLVNGTIDEPKGCVTFHGHTGIIYSISNFPNSRWVLSASADSTARIWDLQTGVWQCTLNGHEDEAMTADASPDGRHLATGSNDCLVRVWKYEQVV